MAAFLVYYPPSSVVKQWGKWIIAPMDHWACESLARVNRDDTIWIVTASAGRLALVAPILVGDVMSYQGACERLGKPSRFFVPARHMTEAYIDILRDFQREGTTGEEIRTAKMAGGMKIPLEGYEAYDESDHHVFAAKKTEEFAKFLDISGRAAELRFISPTGKDRLDVADGRVNPQQFQAMRKLTDASAALLRKIWDSAGPGLRDISRFKPSKKAARAASAPARKKSLLRKADSDELQRLNRQYAKADAKRKRHMVESVERGRAGEAMKKHRGHKCQVCGAMGMNPVGFKTKRGVPYAEAHHVEEVGKGGGLGPENIVVLCANHHRQMHSGNVALVQKTAGEFVFRIDGKRVVVARYSP